MTDEQIDVLNWLLRAPDLRIFWRDSDGRYRRLVGDVVTGGDGERKAYLSGAAHQTYIDLYNCGRDDIVVTLKIDVAWPEE